MVARAIWKGVIRFGDISVPVKLYSAIEDQSVHFRLLDRKDRKPVRQSMVNPETNEVVAFGDADRAFLAENGSLVILEKEELEQLIPEQSRDIEVIAFLADGEIDHRWYDRPYFLGPDGSSEAWSALAHALEKAKLEGLVRWVMRNKEYMGALRLHEGFPILISLRHAEEVVPMEALKAPGGKALDAKELTMARQLIGMLETEFEPQAYRDEYRLQVMDLVESKSKGKKLKKAPSREPQRAERDLSRALKESLKAAKKQ